ncbi:hypothetical protein JZ751_024389, partial [Albula glossodonta]
MEDTESWDMYVQALDKFLTPYNDSIQVMTNFECPQDRYFVQEDSGEVRNNPKRSCQFNRTMLEECSGLTDRYYGYHDGKPCVLIKLNRVRGTARGRSNLGLAEVDHRKYKVGKDEWKEDTEKMGDLMYYPRNGTLNLMYYPYYGKKAQVNYSQPLVAVKFLNITVNEDVNVECKINADVIEPTGNERDKFAGRVSFKLRVNSAKT